MEKPDDAKLEQWQLDDAARLLRLYKIYRDKGGLKQEEFAHEFGLKSQGNMGHYLHGRRPLNIAQAQNFAKGLGLAVEEFSPTLAAEMHQIAASLTDTVDDDAFVDVKRVNVKLSAGYGTEPTIQELVGHLRFTKSFLRNCGVAAASARVVDVKGPSMEPTIKDGAVLLVSTNNKEPINNTIFALARPTEGLIVKRLMKIADGWVARSDNRDYPDIPIDDGEPITIIGRAHWMGAKL